MMGVVNLGEDFDWFAIDPEGAVALFATAGQGFVPPLVVEFHVMHETVAGGIEYPNWGTDEIWNDAAKLGLYVFDWALPDGPYELVSAPQGDIDTALQSMITRITNVPVLRQPLSQLKRIDSVAAFEPNT